MTNEQTDTANNLPETSTSGIIDCMRNAPIQRRRRKGHGCLIYKGDGKPYLAKWTVDGKPVYRTTGETDIRRAEDKLDEFTHINRHQTSVEDMIKVHELQLAILRSKLAKPEIAITELWTTYESKQQWADKSDASKKNYERMIHKLEDWAKRHGCRYVSDMTNEKALAFLKELAEQIGIVTYNNHLTQYKLVWRTLIEAKAYNILTDTWSGKGCEALTDNQNQSAAREPFTPAEIKAILSNADDDMQLLTLISLYTGMRLEDCATLKWDNLDMQHKRLAVKTQKRGVVVRMELYPELYAALEEAQKTATGEYVNERNAKSGNLGDRFGAILDKCDIKRNNQDDKGRTHILKSFHSLRHTHASAYYAEGASMSDVARRIGDTEKTAAKYVHHGYGYTLKGELTDAVREALRGNLCKAA